MSAAGDALPALGARLADGPDAVLVLDALGRVLAANPAARRHWHDASDPLPGRRIDQLLRGLCWHGHAAPWLPSSAPADALEPLAGEGEDMAGRNLLLRGWPQFEADRHSGWLLLLIDITPMRLAERQRDDALRFMSHDARTACASILGMVDLARARPAAVDNDALLAGIEREAQAGLDRADAFLALARAQLQPLRLEALDLGLLLQQAVDMAWSRARQRQARIRLPSALAAAPCLADRGLLARALQALLEHALDRCSPGSDLHCGIAAEGDRWCVFVQDPSPGPMAELHCRLARTVAQRHGGSIEAERPAGGGCSVRLLLPRAAAAPESHEDA